MKKKLLMMLLSVMTAIILLPSVAFAGATENCPGECEHVAAIGTTHYDTLQDAFDAVPTTGATTVSLLKDTNAGAVLNGGRKATLDMQGHTINGQMKIGSTTANDTGDLTITGNGTITYSSATLSDATLYLYNGNLTVENGTYEKEGDSSSGEVVYAYGIFARNGNKLTINGGTFTNKSTAGTTNYALRSQYSTVDISNAEFCCTRSGSAIPNVISTNNDTMTLTDVTSTAPNATGGYALTEGTAGSTLTINGGTYSVNTNSNASKTTASELCKKSVVYIQGGKNTAIKDGTFTARGGLSAIGVTSTGTTTIESGTFTGITYGIYCLNGTTSINGGKFYGAGPAAYATGDKTTLNISSGIFTGNPDLEVNAILAANSAKIAVSGGYFLHPIESSYVPAGTKVPSNTPVVDEVTHTVGSITYNTYYTLEDVSPENAVATITKGDPTVTTSYNSLAGAMEAAVSGDQIVLNKDCAENVKLKEGVTLNIGETNYTGKLSACNGAYYISSPAEGIFENVLCDEEHAVVRIDKEGGSSSYYTTLSYAADTAGSGETIVLLKSLSYSSGNYAAWFESKTVTLDLNGYSISGSFAYAAIMNQGAELTITDSSKSGNSTIKNTYSKSYGCGIWMYNAAGALSLNGVAVNTIRDAIYAQGDTNSSSISVNLKDGASVTSTSYYGLNCYKGNVSLTIDGGSVSSSSNSAVYKGLNSTTNVTMLNDGSISGKYGIYYYSGSGSSIKVESGSITGTQYGVYCTGTSNINISGGTISSTSSYAIVNTGANSTITVDGGTVSGAGYGILGMSKGNTINIKKGSVTATGDGAAVYVNESGNTVNVTGGEVNSEGSAIYLGGSENKAVIDGGTLTGGSFGVCCCGVTSGTGNSVTVNGGCVRAKNVIGMFSGASLTMTGGKLESNVTNGSAVANNGSNTVATTMDISGGTLSAANENCTAIYHPGPGTLTISGDTEITGYDAGIEIRSGTLNISGGTVKALNATYECKPNASGTTTKGAAIAIAQHLTKNDIAATITDGSFEGVKAINECNPQENDPAPQVTMSVSGGKFNGDITTADVKNFVTGGYFSVSADERTDFQEGYVKSGYKAINNNNPEISKTVYPTTIGHVVTFKAPGSDIENQEIEVIHNKKITRDEVTSPGIEGKTFTGWFNDETKEQFLFDDAITADASYTAAFIADSDIGKIKLDETDTGIKADTDIEKSDIPMSSTETSEVQKGSTLKINLVIEKVEEPKTETKEDDKRLVEETVEAKELTLGTYIDVSLVKQLFTEDGNPQGDEVKIEETLNPITVTLTIPENLRVEGRNYTVIRVHNKASEILFQGKADKNWQIVFTTDKFSTYALAYDDSDVKPDPVLPKSYTITFDAAGGSGTMDAVKVRAGKEYTLPECGFTAPEGKQFAGWKIGDKIYQTGDKLTFTGNTKIVAVWKDIPVETVSPFIIAKAVHSGKSAIKISWIKCEGASKYIVYANKCNTNGKKYKVKKIAATDKLTYTISRLDGKKLKKNTFYKMKVVALDADSNKIATSKIIHAATGGYSGKYGNTTKITAKNAETTVSVGQTTTVGIKTYKVYKNKKVATKHAAKVRYLSSNRNIATVNAKGVVTGIKAGTCTVYMQAPNGLWTTTEITVLQNTGEVQGD